MGRAGRLEELDRPLEVRCEPRPTGHRLRAIMPARSCSSAWTHGSSVSSSARSNARCASAFAAERRGALAGPDEHLARRRADLVGVRVVGAGLVGVEVVRGDDLDDLVLLALQTDERNSAAARCFALRSFFEIVS